MELDQLGEGTGFAGRAGDHPVDVVSQPGGKLGQAEPIVEVLGDDLAKLGAGVVGKLAFPTTEAYPLSPVMAIPRTKYFWKKRKTATVGMSETSVIAIKKFHFA